MGANLRQYGCELKAVWVQIYSIMGANLSQYGREFNRNFAAINIVSQLKAKIVVNF